MRVAAAASGTAMLLAAAVAGLGLQAGGDAVAKLRNCKMGHATARYTDRSARGHGCPSYGSRTGIPGAYVDRPDPLPRRLGVDEKEYSIYPSYNPVGSGRVEFHVTNFGMDAHDFSIRNTAGSVLWSTPLAPGGKALITVNLTPGEYTLFCSLADHEALGMRARLTVR
jgi:plastocyanin